MCCCASSAQPVHVYNCYEHWQHWRSRHDCRCEHGVLWREWQFRPLCEPQQPKPKYWPRCHKHIYCRGCLCVGNMRYASVTWRCWPWSQLVRQHCDRVTDVPKPSVQCVWVVIQNWTPILSLPHNLFMSSGTRTLNRKNGVTIVGYVVRDGGNNWSYNTQSSSCTCEIFCDSKPTLFELVFLVLPKTRQCSESSVMVRV